MTTYKHIVQVHPVENGEPNLYKVVMEREYSHKFHADRFIANYNADGGDTKAVYLGRVNCLTGELE